MRLTSGILKANADLAQSALRVLGFAFRNCPDSSECTEESLERDMIFCRADRDDRSPRAEAIEAITVCKQIHIKPVMITGDHKLTAVAIAREMGLYHEGDIVMVGDELAKMTEDELEKSSKVTVYARVSPTDKLKIVKAWKNRVRLWP